MMNKEEIEYCLKQFYKNKQGFKFENGLQISLYKVFEQLNDLQQRINDAIELLQVLHYNFPDYDDMHEKIEEIEKTLGGLYVKRESNSKGDKC